MDIYRKEGKKIIFGKGIPVFIYNAGYHLTNLEIYQDGKIDCWDLVSFEEFKEKVKSGWVRTSMENDSKLSLFPLGHLKCKNFKQSIKEDELIKEVEDTINELNGKLTTSEICRQSFDEYVKISTEENKGRLKKAYENIPEHKRVYVLGNMDVDDIPIRVALYGVDSEKGKFKYQLQRKLIDGYLQGINSDKTRSVDDKLNQYLSQQMDDYLIKTFGENIIDIVNKPDGTQIGERVLYKYKDNRLAIRREATPDDLKEMHSMLKNVLPDQEIITEMPVSSGLPSPRLVDIPEHEIVYSAKKYLDSDNLLPSPDFNLEWVFGFIFWGSRRELIYIDFTHEKVKAMFTADYDIEYEDNIDRTSLVKDWLKSFVSKREESIQEAISNTAISWIKISQENEVLEKNIK